MQECSGSGGVVEEDEGDGGIDLKMWACMYVPFKLAVVEKRKEPLSSQPPRFIAAGSSDDREHECRYRCGFHLVKPMFSKLGREDAEHEA